MDEAPRDSLIEEDKLSNECVELLPNLEPRQIIIEDGGRVGVRKFPGDPLEVMSRPLLLKWVGAAIDKAQKELDEYPGYVEKLTIQVNLRQQLIVGLKAVDIKCPEDEEKLRYLQLALSTSEGSMPRLTVRQEEFRALARQLESSK